MGTLYESNVTADKVMDVLRERAMLEGIEKCNVDDVRQEVAALTKRCMDTLWTEAYGFGLNSKSNLEAEKDRRRVAQAIVDGKSEDELKQSMLEDLLKLYDDDDESFYQDRDQVDGDS